MRSEPTTDLVRTKLNPPGPGGSLITRKSLLDRLNQAAEYKITLLSAPAGFGKTILVSEWLAEQRKAQAPVAWISLDASDNDPLRFWRYVFTAVQTFAIEAGNQALSILENSQRFDYEGILTALVNRLVSHQETQYLIFEDFQAITSPIINESILFLLEHLPQTLHLVILTRSDPPLPLARMRARNEILELRAPELRFSPAEIREFFQRIAPHSLSADAVDHLAARTEGWPAALRLVALALQSKKTAAEQGQFLTSFTGSHRSIFDYLLSDVFTAQALPVQEFLLQTSFLNRLTGDLCNAVTGRKNSAQLLDQLERAGLFLETLDGNRRWYRFHGLFAEAMQQLARQRLGETVLRQLMLKASQWYEDQVQKLEHQPDGLLNEAESRQAVPGPLLNEAESRQAVPGPLLNEAESRQAVPGPLLNEAVETALSADAFERAAVLIERTIKSRLAGNEYHTLQRWLQRLPEPVLASHPIVAMAYAQALLFTTPFVTAELLERIRKPLGAAEQAWNSAGNEARLGEILAFQALMAARRGDYPESFFAARAALKKLPERGDSLSEIEWRAVSLNLVGWEDYLAGRLNNALPELISARGFFQMARNLYGILDTTLALGEVYAGRAEARQAEVFYRQVLAESEAAPLARHERLRRQGRALLGLAKLAYDQDRLEEAARLASEALQAAGDNNIEDVLVSGALLLVQAARAKGDEEDARARLTALTAQVKRPHLAREVQSWLNWMALSAGHTAAAYRRETSAPEPAGGIPFYVREREKLVAIRRMLLTGEAQAALDRCQAGLTEAREQGRFRSELDMLIQMSEALAAINLHPEAVDALRQALRLAQRENYRRVFLDEAEALAALWREAISGVDGPEAKWAQALFHPEKEKEADEKPYSLAGFGGSGESLSRQEGRVLRLLGEGLSNEEIAQELVVSINTVKTHVKSIYRKLQVGNRREARQAARRLPPHR